MQVKIIRFYNLLSIGDHILIGLSLTVAIAFIFLGVGKIYKSYLGLIFGLFLFTIINLFLFGLIDKDLGTKSSTDFLIENRLSLGIYSILFIPILGFLLPFNDSIHFRFSKNNILNYITSFLFGLMFVSFFICIFLSIVNNKFLFGIDLTIIEGIKKSYLIEEFIKYFSNPEKPSIIFNFLFKYDYIINLVIIIFIFYKMTIGGIVDFILLKLALLIKKLLKNVGEEEKSDK